jgi:hypothetical protein
MKKTILFASLFILCTTLFAQGKYYVRVMGRSDLNTTVIKQLESKFGKSEDVFQNKTLKTTVVTVSSHTTKDAAEKRVSEIKKLKKATVHHVYIVPEHIPVQDSCFRIQLSAGKNDLPPKQKDQFLDVLSVLHLPFLVEIEKKGAYNRKFMVETKFSTHEMAAKILPILKELGLKGAFIVGYAKGDARIK